MSTNNEQNAARNAAREHAWEWFKFHAADHLAPVAVVGRGPDPAPDDPLGRWTRLTLMLSAALTALALLAAGAHAALGGAGAIAAVLAFAAVAGGAVAVAWLDACLRLDEDLLH